MSVLDVKPGQMGNSIILSRLEKGSAPLTVHIPTSKQQVSMMIYIHKVNESQKIRAQTFVKMFFYVFDLKPFYADTV